MQISRAWSMPNRWTFQMKPVKELLKAYYVGKGWVDPFAGKSTIAEYSTDLSTGTRAFDALTYHSGENVKGVLLDPPYSPRQVSECYKGLGLPVTQSDTQNQWTHVKDAAMIIIEDGGYCISFGWNSAGLGKKRGFKIMQILLINHGAAHNDTIVTIERKTTGL